MKSLRQFVSERKPHILGRLGLVVLVLILLPLPIRAETDASLRVHISWGHTKPVEAASYVKLLTNELTVSEIVPWQMESNDSFKDTVYQGRAGEGDVDGFDVVLRFESKTIVPISNPHRIWSYLLANGDADTSRRLQRDPGFRSDTRRLIVQMNPDGTRGFSLTVDQLLTSRCFWIPELDVFVSAGDSPVSYAAHQESLRTVKGRRVLDQVAQDPDASYEQYTARWEDMGYPGYKNPDATGNGHIVCVSWDSALYKFGIDRGAGVRNDFGNPDHFSFQFDFGDLSRDLTKTWKGQSLDDGLPILTTTFEKDGVRYQVEQFAYPLNGPPSKRSGDIPMVLLQKVRVIELEGKTRTMDIGMTHQRELPSGETAEVKVEAKASTWTWEESSGHQVLMAIEGTGLTLQADKISGTKPKVIHTVFSVSLPANSSHEFVVKLPSPLVAEADRERFAKLDYATARAATRKFWSDYLAAGAQFVVPEKAVNTLYRANLWHALRLPRRLSGSGDSARMDLPYSNFAYDQKGTPWPVNQAVYVDYMLYDLRGYHDISAEELAVMFRENQEANGHIKGFANWGVYTPGMLYSVAQHYRLTGDRSSLDRLLPQSLKAMDWCLAEIEKAGNATSSVPGLVLAPLNDLSSEPRAWAFNQAYLFAGLDAFAGVLEEIQHPRLRECRAAADALQRSIDRYFGRASLRSPLVQLGDNTWMPNVPCDALTPRRMFDVWYPTDVDTGAMHLPRLRALDPKGDLATYLLHDHEDNLFFKGWGMANEPVYNQQATVYLLRNDVKPAIRAFYSMMACAFSHSVFEPVEHRWGWGQYFGPPSTDGAWFELYRNMLIHEGDDNSLFLLQAAPRAWLEDGKKIRIERAPTYYGILNLSVESHAASGTISAAIDMPSRKRPSSLLVRFRHPQSLPLRTVSVNGNPWSGFDAQEEWVVIPNPADKQYTIIAQY
jgi:hypothetical protein